MENLKPIVAGDRVHRPLFDKRVTAEDWQKAKDELNETPETRRRLLKQLKGMLARQNEFVPQTDDNYLLRFLRSRKFDLEKSYKLIQQHYKFRAKYADFFPTPSSLKYVFDLEIYNYLPYRDHHGRAIYFCRASTWDTDKVPYTPFSATGTLLSEYVLDNPVTQINGYVGLWDFKGFGLKQFANLCNPRFMWIFRSMLQDSLPGRFKAAYCINCHPLAHKAWNLFKSLLKEKFRNRLIVLGPENMSELYKYLDPCILPEEYGGSFPNNTSEHIVKRVLEDEEYINYSRSFGYPAKKRIADTTSLGVTK